MKVRHLFLAILTTINISLIVSPSFGSTVDSLDVYGKDSLSLLHSNASLISTTGESSVVNYFEQRNEKITLHNNVQVISTQSFENEINTEDLTYTGQVKSTVASALDYITAYENSTADEDFVISQERLVKDLRHRISHPSELNQGVGTNFCWAAAFSTYLLSKDPKGISQAILTYYETGVFTYGQVSITPNPQIKANIGTETFANNTGLDNNVVDQMLLMTLATQYQGYINFDKNYESGDEEKGTYAGRPIGAYEKLFTDFGINYRRVGSDLGWTGENADQLSSLIQNNTIFLYVNSGFLFRDGKLPLTGSHYVILQNINIDGDLVTFNYWDYGHKEGRTLTMTVDKFNKGTFGAIIVPTENYQNGLAKQIAH